MIFDDTQASVRSAYHMATVIQPEILAEFDQWLGDTMSKIAELKAVFGVN